MIRRIIQIDEEKCNGCGACAKACHEGAIGMVNGKTKRIPLGEVAGKLKTVDPDSQMIKEAKRTGISFGD